MCTIRRRRGLSLDTAAGLAGITKPYLSMVENGHRRFELCGLLEDIARALDARWPTSPASRIYPVTGQLGGIRPGSVQSATRRTSAATTVTT